MESSSGDTMSEAIDFKDADEWAKDPLPADETEWLDSTVRNAARAYQSLRETQAVLVEALLHQRYRSHAHTHHCDGCLKATTALELAKASK
jgi:hypothetical protein